MSGLTDDSLDAIVQAHRRSYGRSDACVCGEAYPCSTVGLVVEVKRLRAEVARLTDGIRDILNRFTERGHPGRPSVRTSWQSVEQVARWRSLLDVAGDDALDEIVRVSEDAGLYDMEDGQ